MRTFSYSTVLFLALTSGCFGSRNVSGRDSDGGDSSNRDSSASDRENTGGSDARFDARITGSGGSVSLACGNNVTENGEMCDGPDLAGASCQSLGLGDGLLACTADCVDYDISLCYDVYIPSVCGNDIKENGEMCDGRDLASRTCWSLMPGFFGTLRCARDCLSFDTSLCYENVDDGGI